MVVTGRSGPALDMTKPGPLGPDAPVYPSGISLSFPAEAVKRATEQYGTSLLVRVALASYVRRGV